MNSKNEPKCQRFLNLSRLSCCQKKAKLSKIETLPQNDDHDLEAKLALEKSEQVGLLLPQNSAESTQRTGRNYAMELKKVNPCEGEIIPEEYEDTLYT